MERRLRELAEALCSKLHTVHASKEQELDPRYKQVSRMDAWDAWVESMPISWKTDLDGANWIADFKTWLRACPCKR